MIKAIFRKILPENIRIILNKYRQTYKEQQARHYYSSLGEDVILESIFSGKNEGFYIDVGAHHPKKGSNTYLFYRKGWHGINIDAMPGSMKKFNKTRSKDINLEVPISDKNDTLTFYMFNAPELNTFSKPKADDNLKTHKLLNTATLHTNTLSSVLKKHLPDNQVVDFLTIDVEGYDFAVLRSNDWNKIRPKVILVEILHMPMEDIINHEIALFLKSHGYLIFAKTYNTVVFMQNEFFKERAA